jgi:hypothetical protein
MSETKIEYAMTIADDEYNKIYYLVCDLRYGKRLKDKKGQEVRFFVKEKKMYGEVEKDGKKMIQEVIPQSKVLQKQLEVDPAKFHLMNKLKEDFPEMDEKELEAHFDIIMEANNTLHRLTAIGITKEMATVIVKRALAEQTDEIKEIVQKMIDDKSAVEISPDIVEK